MTAYDLNRLVYELGTEESRSAYQADAENYMRRFNLTHEERRLILARDWTGLKHAGVGVYVLARLAEVHGMSLLELGMAMRGQDQAQFDDFLKEQNSRVLQFAVTPEGLSG